MSLVGGGGSGGGGGFVLFCPILEHHGSAAAASIGDTVCSGVPVLLSACGLDKDWVNAKEL